MTKNTHRRWAILLTALLVSLAMPVLAADLPVVDLTIHDAKFEPDQIKVPAGKKFKLRVTNKGPAIEEFESNDLNRERIVPVGSSVELYVGPLKPGRYKVFGDFHPNTAKAELVAE